MNEITQILSAIEQGQPQAAEQLLPLVYDELRKLAAARLAHEKPGQTLQATALVHEAYLRLVGGGGIRGRETGDREGEASAGGEYPERARFDGRAHFFAAAAEAMRRILVENARRKQREKHGGLRQRVELPGEGIASSPRDDQLILLDEALSRLQAIRPQAAELVTLRYFGGQTAVEAAAIVGVSERTARRLWVYAQAWLRREMEKLDGGKSLADN